MKNCGCHYCREYNDCECDERHPPEEIVRAKTSGEGAYYWGPRVKEARGRWVKICKPCIAAFDSEGFEEELEATFFAK